MKELVMLYVLRYGVEDTLRQVADGLAEASGTISTWTTEGRQKMSAAATDIYTLINMLRREEEAAFAARVSVKKATNKGS